MIRFGIAGFGLHAVRAPDAGVRGGKELHGHGVDAARCGTRARVGTGIWHCARIHDDGGAVRLPRGGCGVHRDSGCIAPGRRGGGGETQEAHPGRETDGHERRRGAADGGGSTGRERDVRRRARNAV